MADDKLEQRQLATAFSDLVLCIASLYSIWVSKNSGYYGATGFLIIAVASGLGSIRFSVLLPSIHGTVLMLHQYFSFLSSAAGISLIAAEYCKQANYNWVSFTFVVASVAGPAIHALGIMKPNIAGVGLIAIIAISLLNNKPGMKISGVTGSLLFMIGGVIIVNKDRGFLGLANVDWFHYVLAAGVLALADGIR